MRILIAVLLLFATLASAVTRTAKTGTVRWSNPSTWNPAGLPSAGDDVEIPVSSNVIFDAVTPRYVKLIYF